MLSRDKLKCLGLDLATDVKNVHPPGICGACQMKLSRWKTQRALKKAHVPPSITLNQVLAHDEDCQLCVGDVWDLIAIQKYFQGKG